MAALVQLTLVVYCSLIGHGSTQDATVVYNVREEQPKDQYLGSVALGSQLFNDVTNEKFQRLQFQILKESSNDANYFRIEANTSLLWTSKEIDRESYEECSLDCKLNFNVAVYDLDSLELTKLIKIVVTIEDLNDNTPEFLPIINPIEILESIKPGSLIVAGAAVDLDKGKDNSVQTYGLLHETDIFNLTVTENMEFEIRLANPLDRESKTFYEIVVLAKDAGKKSLTGTVTLNIEVIDDNDNFPKFSELVYNKTVEENVDSDAVILSVYATDKDEGDNGRVSYKFSNRVSYKISEMFLIHSSTGDLSTVDTIDFETDKEFRFQVIAYDHGSPAKSSTSTIIITVTDSNDNSPIINLNQPPGGTVLSELAGIGAFVTHVEIMDLDSGKNGKVVCNILDNNFKLETMGIADNYKIVLNKTLDHDVKAIHNVSILCQDTGSLPRQTLANFIVHVEDVNDNAPIFSESMYTVSINENNVVGVSIIGIHATDIDSGVNALIAYSLHVESSGLFLVDSFTGIITANVSLDRETHGDQRIFRVLATDKGKPALTSTGTVVINIHDLNDNDPIFRNDPLKLYVFENLRSGTEVGNVSASDPDIGLNGTFHLKFPDNPNILEYFEFHQSGIITTRKMLDRELISFHKFYVHAVDMGGRTSSTLVVVYVKDLNDNGPEIIYPNDYNNTIRMIFSQPENSEVIQIDARDSDAAENSNLYYYIDQDNASYAFKLDTHSGKLILNKTLHEKDIGLTYSFVFRVKDGGEPSFSTWTEFNIQIIASEMTSGTPKDAISNLWIVVGIVIITSVLSVIMIIIIAKICWHSRLKGTSGSTSVIIVESHKVDPRLIDSSSSGSTSSKDSNGNEKIKDGRLQIQDGYQKRYFSNLDENGCLTNSSLASIDNQLYVEQVKKFGYDLQRKIDETNSDNSGEMGTHDSGQGCSDVDLNSLTELPVLDIPESSTDSNLPSPRQNLQSNYGPENLHTSNIYNDILPPFPKYGYHSNSNNSDSTSDTSFVPKSAVSFSKNPTKTAERKEISKLRKSQKRVMFSDDLENSHSSGRSSTLSTHSNSDISQLNDSRSPQRFRRMFSEDNSGSAARLNRANDWRRSVDDFSRRPTNDRIYNQLPSNQIKFGIGSDFRKKPMGSNIKTYLSKVMEKSKSNGLNGSHSSKSSDDIRIYSVDTLTSESSSRENDSITTTSGTYDLMDGENRLSLASPTFSDIMFIGDIEV